jgi:CRP-like cAMP-binding protein
VTAETDVQIGVLGVRMFRILLRELPAISERLLAGLAHELREAQRSR